MGGKFFVYAGICCDMTENVHFCLKMKGNDSKI